MKVVMMCKLECDEGSKGGRLWGQRREEDNSQIIRNGVLKHTYY